MPRYSPVQKSRLVAKVDALVGKGFKVYPACEKLKVNPVFYKKWKAELKPTTVKKKRGTYIKRVDLNSVLDSGVIPQQTKTTIIVTNDVAGTLRQIWGQ